MADRTRILLVGAIVPALIALIGVVLIVIALPDLPDPVAIHWGASGAADGFGPALANLIFLPLLVLGYAAFSLLALRGVGVTVSQRILLVTSPFLATLLTATLGGSLWIQRGLDDASAAPSVTPLILGGTIAGLALAVGAWFVLPPASPVDEDTVEPESLELGATERAVWMRRMAPSGMVAGLAIGTLVLVTALGVVALALSAPLFATLLYGGILILVALLVVSTLFWRVRVTQEGLEVRSAVGIPRFVVQIADVDTASLIEVEPVRDFGGWGLRWGGLRRFGVITRRGEALEVRRRSGKVFVVTVDDARNAAALLNSLVARRGTMS
jgi:hypothetical protein